MVFAHHIGVDKFVMHFLEQFRVCLVLHEFEDAVPLYHNSFQILVSHDSTASESAEMAIGIDINAGHRGGAFCR